MELDEYLLKPQGYMAMINQNSWMFQSSFERYREKMLSNRTIISMLHLGARAFEESRGEIVQSTAFIIKNTNIKQYGAIYKRLVDYDNANSKESEFHKSKNEYLSKKTNFIKIPGNIISYWVNEKLIDTFEASDPLIK